jgi:hypothetical protein
MHIKQYIREKVNPLLLFIYKINSIVVNDSLLFCNQDEKRLFIKSTYLRRSDIKTFIETGTYKGDTVEYVKNDFNKIFTIELSEKYADEAIERFKNEEKVKVIKGDSKVELVKLLKDIKEPCIFWLDGHYSYADTAQAEKETPILEEIRPILEMEESHVILIDDARLFIGRHNYPTIIKLANFVKKINKNYKMSIEKDIILLIKK